MEWTDVLALLDGGSTLIIVFFWLYLYYTERIVSGKRVQRLERQLIVWQNRTLRALRLLDRGEHAARSSVDLLEEELDASDA